MTPPSESNNQKLESWGEIAAFFKRDIRTVQRWEKRENMPVHRHIHADRGSVYAIPSELRAWQDKRKSTKTVVVVPERRRHWIAIAVGTVLAGVTLVAFGISRFNNVKTGPPAVVRTGRLFAGVTAEDGRWSWLGLKGAHHLAFSPAEDRLYVTLRDGYLKVLDTKTDQVTRSIYLGPMPRIVAAAQDGRVYVASNASGLWAVNIADSTVRFIATGSKTTGLALRPAGRVLYVASGYNGLAAMDTQTFKMTPIPTVACPMSLIAAPLTNRLYVSYRCGGPGGREGHDAIEARDLTSGVSLATASGPPMVGGEFRLRPGGDRIWADAADACLNPRYDHQGCIPGKPGLAAILRTEDLVWERTIGLEDGAVVHFFPDGRQVLLGSNFTRILNTSTYWRTEDLGSFLSGDLQVLSSGGKAYLQGGPDADVAILRPRSIECEPPSYGLTQFWSGDGVAEDERSGLLVASPQSITYAPGLVGRAFRLQPGHRLEADPFRQRPGVCGPTDFSVAFWMKHGSMPDEGNALVSCLDLFGKANWAVTMTSDQRVQFKIRTGDSAAIVVKNQHNIALGEWHHVAVTRDAGSIALYIDGSQAGTLALPSAPLTRNPGRTIFGGGTFDGQIDELLHYPQVALTAKQIRQIYESATGPCVANPK